VPPLLHASQHDLLKPMKPALPRTAYSCSFLLPDDASDSDHSFVEACAAYVQPALESHDDRPSCFMTHGETALLVAVCDGLSLMVSFMHRSRN
jgi:hypothetical protein